MNKVTQADNQETSSRLYFSCHPDDFDTYFDKICDDIFRTHNCTIFYATDMYKTISEEDLDVEIGRCNLIVIPVTFKLLTTNNNTMDIVFPFAIKHNIPILPIVMEKGIDELYSKPDKFGELQYLNAYSEDLTEIPYKQKLKKYLDLVLNSDETVQRVRNSFDGHMFLSYRKKDRKYANDLIRIIHSNPECRSVAIWFDEFLNPGENFSESIRKNLNSSDLFVLLVTPNLLEEKDGRPNYVLREEYPIALNSGISILPAEMKKTNLDELIKKFISLPECINPISQNEKFRNELITALSKVKKTHELSDREYNFFIGIAYVDGIDVEINHSYGIELIQAAAEKELPEAMKKMYSIYCSGVGVSVDYQNARKWAERLVKYNIEKYGVKHRETIESLNDLAYAFLKAGEYKIAAELHKKIYGIRKELNGADNLSTISDLNSLAYCYMKLKDYNKALILYKFIYNFRNEMFGDENPEVVDSLYNLGRCYDYLEKYEDALEKYKKTYHLQCILFGEKHIDAISTLYNLAKVYERIKDYDNAIKAYKESYLLHSEAFGKYHIYTHIILNQFANLFVEMKNYQKALELYNILYSEEVKTYGKDDLMTLSTLLNIANMYRCLKRFNEALEKEYEVYVSYAKIKGEEDPDTITVLGSLAFTYYQTNDIEKAYKLYKRTLNLQQKVFGMDHGETIVSKKMLELIEHELNSSEEQS